MDLQRKLKSSLNHFLESGDLSILASVINDHSELITNTLGEYPDFHRILDVRIGDRCYRFCREISAGEALKFFPIDEALETTGVPLWLEGTKLRAWAKAEEENPSDGPTDWSLYR